MLEFAAHRQPENELYVHRIYERRGALCEGWFKASSKLHKKKPKADLTPFDPHGAKGWQGPVTFDALVDMPHQCFLPYTPTFQCKLFDLSAHGMEELAGNAMVRVISDLLRAQSLSQTKEGLEKLRSAFT
ncbi:hypothetical protein, partial [Desulfobulbus alkaliphilus]|uniref:hypothetical protein n=1 Tax=Desulfobulbus alkaliphilus TaxID=869814 RepID=UPI0019634B5B